MLPPVEFCKVTVPVRLTAVAKLILPDVEVMFAPIELLPAPF